MMISVSWLSPERVDASIQELKKGDLIDFGYCPKDREFTPAILESLISKPARVVCGLCGLSSYENPGQHYPGYSIRSKMRGKCVEELIALGLDTIEGQKEWLYEKLQSQYERIEKEASQLADRLQVAVDEKAHTAEAICLLREV